MSKNILYWYQKGSSQNTDIKNLHKASKKTVFLDLTQLNILFLGKQQLLEPARINIYCLVKKRAVID